MKKITRKNEMEILEETISSFKKKFNRFYRSLDVKFDSLHNELEKMNEICFCELRSIDQWLSDLIEYIKDRK